MVKITLPNPNDYQYKGGVKHFLRQLELCVHHAQKAYKEITRNREEAGEEKHSDEEWVMFRQPDMDLYDILEQNEGTENELPNGYVKVHVDCQIQDGQNIVLEINQ